MARLKAILLFLFSVIPTFIFATTWDEPWQEEVIRDADYFVLATIKSSHEESVTIEIIKSLGGPEINGTINITNFNLLRLCSRSGGHGPEFHFKGIKECYFFIKKNSKGEYCIATPTSGFAPVRGEKVTASYRHSYHQASVPIDIYERTMTAIFNNYHNLLYDKLFIADFVERHLSLKPASFGANEIDTFFAQHVALECVYHLRLAGKCSQLLPFLNDTTNFHNQVSGARALVSCNTTEVKLELLTTIRDSTRPPFVQVMCIWTLTEFKPIELKQELITIEKTASEEHDGFGGNIMDPRVCTNFPAVKDALNKLILSL